MDRGKFQEGTSTEAFVGSIEDSIEMKYQALLDESRANYGLPEFISALLVRLNVMANAEAWPGEVPYNLPPLLMLADSPD